LRLSDRAVRFGLKPIVFVASLGPFFYLVWAALTGNLSADLDQRTVVLGGGARLKIVQGAIR